MFLFVAFYTGWDIILVWYLMPLATCLSWVKNLVSIFHTNHIINCMPFLQLPQLQPFHQPNICIRVNRINGMKMSCQNTKPWKKVVVKCWAYLHISSPSWFLVGHKPQLLCSNHWRNSQNWGQFSFFTTKSEIWAGRSFHSSIYIQVPNNLDGGAYHCVDFTRQMADWLDTFILIYLFMNFLGLLCWRLHKRMDNELCPVMRTNKSF